MRKSNIIEKLSGAEDYAVVAEEYKKFSRIRVRLWTYSAYFQDKRDIMSLRGIFPNLEKQGLLIKLGEYASLTAANSALARARAMSPVIQKFFLLPFKKVSPPKSKPFGIVRQSKRKVVIF